MRGQPGRAGEEDRQRRQRAERRRRGTRIGVWSGQWIGRHRVRLAPASSPAPSPASEARIVAPRPARPWGAAMTARDDTFQLYDLRVEVVATDRPMVCSHRAGDAFEVHGENLVMPAGGTFSLYALAALLPLLPAKQRPTASPRLDDHRRRGRLSRSALRRAVPDQPRRLAHVPPRRGDGRAAARVIPPRRPRARLHDLADREGRLAAGRRTRRGRSPHGDRRHARLRRRRHHHLRLRRHLHRRRVAHRRRSSASAAGRPICRSTPSTSPIAAGSPA